MQNTRTLERELLRPTGKAPLNERGTAPTIIKPYDDNSRLNEHLVEELNQAKKNAFKTIDLFDEMLMELMLIEHPEYKSAKDRIVQLLEKFQDDYLAGQDKEYCGTWVYFSNRTLIHLLCPDDHFKIRTSRNLGLLTEIEQESIRRAKVAVGGLSVGGLCATTLAMEGVTNFYITDFDTLACSNLNRISSSISSIGIDKTAIVAEKIWDIDPFINIEMSTLGYCSETEELIFCNGRKPEVFIDAMDSLEAKIAAREACRKHRVPLVWMIDMGDGVVQIGTERYDLDASYPAFHGNLQKLEKRVNRQLDYVESCFGIFNNHHLPSRMARSFYLACNNRWPGISQLAGTVSIAAGVISRVTRKLILKEEVVPEFFIEVDEKADPHYIFNREADREKTMSFIRSLGLTS